MTRKPSRLRLWLKWVALSVCVVIATGWLATLWWNATYRYLPDRSGHILSYVDFALSDGEVRVDHVMGEPNSCFGPGWEEGLRIQRHQPGPISLRRPTFYWPEVPDYSASRPLVLKPLKMRVTLPLWIPFFGLLVPTAYLWYRDRRPPPGHCQCCGYDLTGNESGRCPECGVEVCLAPKTSETNH